MPKASILILRQNQDGIHAEVFHWDTLNAGEVPPPGFGVHQFVQKARVAADFTADRMSTTRTALKAALATYIDAKFAETP